MTTIAAAYTDQIKNSDKFLYDKLLQKYIVDTPVRKSMKRYSTMKALYYQGGFIGEGGFGSVRWGIGHSGAVAIKTVKLESVNKSSYWRRDDYGNMIPKEVYFLQFLGCLNDFLSSISTFLAYTLGCLLLQTRVYMGQIFQDGYSAK